MPRSNYSYAIPSQTDCELSSKIMVRSSPDLNLPSVYAIDGYDDSAYRGYGSKYFKKIMHIFDI